jgi:hypothetical protein
VIGGQKGKVEPLTTTTSVRRRDVNVFWVYAEEVFPDGADMLAGWTCSTKRWALPISR